MFQWFLLNKRNEHTTHPLDCCRGNRFIGSTVVEFVSLFDFRRTDWTRRELVGTKHAQAHVSTRYQHGVSRLKAHHAQVLVLVLVIRRAFQRAGIAFGVAFAGAGLRRVAGRRGRLLETKRRMNNRTKVLFTVRFRRKTRCFFRPIVALQLHVVVDFPILVVQEPTIKTLQKCIVQCLQTCFFAYSC